MDQPEGLQQWFSDAGGDVQLLAGALLAYAVAETVTDIAKGSPLWLVKTILLRPAWRYSVELRYLVALLRTPNLKRWRRKYVTLRAIMAAEAGEPSSRPLLDTLRDLSTSGKKMVVLGEPGSGKTTCLEALAHRLAQRALWHSILVWSLVFGLVGIAIALHCWWWGLLLMGIGLLDFLLPGLPILAELRLYKSGTVDEFLRERFAVRIGGNAISNALATYTERGRLVCLVDGVNEVRSDVYDTALDAWRECFDAAHRFADVSVIFTSRSQHNPAGRLRCVNVVRVLDLDDNGVRQFLTVYGASDVDTAWNDLKTNKMLEEGGIGRNPYWLNLIVQSGLYTKNQGARFERFCRKLIERELDKGEVYPAPASVPVDDEMETLGGLGYAMSKAGQVGSSLKFAETSLRDFLKQHGGPHSVQEVLREAEGATLLHTSRREDRADFSHQLVQEFFTAYALRLRPAEAIHHVGDVRWWQSLLMLVGLVDEPMRLIRDVLSQDTNGRQALLAAVLLECVDQTSECLARQIDHTLTQTIQETATAEQMDAVADIKAIAPSTMRKALRDRLGMGSPAVKRAVLVLLRDIGGGWAAEVAAHWQILLDPTITEPLDELFATIGQPAVEPLIAAAAAGAPINMEPRVLRVIRQIGESAVEPLLAVSRCEGEWLRWTAASVLGELNDARAVGPLLAALRDRNEYVRREAAIALGKINDARAVERLLAALRDEDAYVSRVTAEALGEINDARAVGPLLATLRDGNWDVRGAAAGALGKINDPRAVEPLLAALWDRNGDVRRVAAGALGKINDPRAVEHLLDALYDENGDVRRVAAEALGKINDPRAVEPLLKALADRNRDVRGAAAGALGKINDARAVEPLLAALHDESWHVRRAAAEALGEINDARVVEPLLAALHDESWYVRRAAAGALGLINDARVVEPLLATLCDGQWDVRWAAVEALGMIRDVRAVEPLLTALRDGAWMARRAAAEVLGKINDARAVGPLLGALYDQDWGVRQAAAEALGKINDARAVEPLLEALGDGDRAVRRAVAEALGKINDARAVAPLLATLRDGDRNARSAAAEVLGKINEARAVAPLLAMLLDGNWEVASAAAGALTKINDARAVGPLLTALRDGNDDVRRVAAEALGKINDPRAVEPLFAALGDGDRLVRRVAAEALTKINDARAVGPLLTALRDGDDDVRRVAAEALGKINDARAAGPLLAAIRDNNEGVRRAAAKALATMICER